MILIIGGAYQGKLDYAREEFQLKDEEIFDASVNDEAVWPELDFKARGINHLERFVLACVREGIEAGEYLKMNAGQLRDKIILADDISQGIVPMDKTERAWREETGRCLVFLGKEADKVVRVFCGIPQVIKE